MGAWGDGVFESDAALDWADNFGFGNEAETVSNTLTYVTKLGEAYLEVGESYEALGAAEVVAALRGFPTADLPQDVATWVSEQHMRADDDLVALALQAVDRVRTDSELLELWEEGIAPPVGWYAVIDDLKDRLRRPIS